MADSNPTPDAAPTPAPAESGRANQGRRNFLRLGVAAAAAAATMPVWATPKSASAQSAGRTDTVIPGKGKAKRMIVLSLAGGPPHHDTFDPKVDEGVKGEFDAIPTALDGCKFAEVFPNLAKQAGELCVVRSVTTREGNHERARYLTHTGHPPTPTVKHPILGSILAEELGDDEFELPAFVAISGNPGDGGYLGPTRAPLLIANPERGIDNLNYRPGVEDERMQRRLRLRDEADREFRRERRADIPDAQKAMYERAKRMMDSPRSKAFDLNSADSDERNAYGRNTFGQSVLMARRLLEQGVTCVEVTQGGWDTHDDNFTRVRTLASSLDVAYAKLIQDLKRSGLWDETIVACFGEFGRTPRINGRNGRDHWPRAWTMVLGGGPIARGRVIGQTDETGSNVDSDPVTIPDFFHSMAHAFDFDAMRRFDVNDRPIWYADKDGKVVRKLFD